MNNQIKQIPVTELIKIQDFVNDTPSNSDDNSFLSNGEVLDHVMDKLNHLATHTPYIDEWANERFINKTYKTPIEVQAAITWFNDNRDDFTNQDRIAIDALTKHINNQPHTK